MWRVETAKELGRQTKEISVLSNASADANGIVSFMIQLMIACKCGYLLFVMNMKNKFKKDFAELISEDQATFCGYAASGGHLSLLKYLCGQLKFSWDSQTCTFAEKGGHLDVLMYALDNGCPYNALEANYKTLRIIFGRAAYNVADLPIDEILVSACFYGLYPYIIKNAHIIIAFNQKQKAALSVAGNCWMNSKMLAFLYSLGCPHNDILQPRSSVRVSFCETIFFEDAVEFDTWIPDWLNAAYAEKDISRCFIHFVEHLPVR